jgi:FMN phosphatase YigB (HAD superfamily)
MNIFSRVHCNFLIVITLAPLFAYGKETIYLPDSLTLAQARQLIQERKPTNDVEFAFDIHEVLLQSNEREQVDLAYRYPRKILFLKNLFNMPLLTQLGALFWQWIIDITGINDKKAEATSEQLVVIFMQAGQYEMSDFIVRLANAQVVDKQMMPLIQKLKDLGYPRRVASNIGKTVYEKLKILLDERGENIFALFDKDIQGNEGKVVDYAHSQASKPSDQYFQEYLAAYNPDGKKLIIFIDDKKKNVRAAVRNGFVGIHFSDAKHLEKDLQELGIFS